jgi:hypothetical protein
MARPDSKITTVARHGIHDQKHDRETQQKQTTINRSEVLEVS